MATNYREVKPHRTGYTRDPEYIVGNTAPQRELTPTVPNKFDERRRKEEERRRRAAQRIEIEKQTRVNRKASRTYSMGQILAIAVTFVVLLTSCVFFLRMQSSVTLNEQTIADLRAEYEMINTENNNTQAAIDSQIDYDEIFRVATQELNMVHPQKYQIVNFDRTESEYVRQYDELP